MLTIKFEQFWRVSCCPLCCLWKISRGLGVDENRRFAFKKGNGANENIAYRFRKFSVAVLAGKLFAMPSLEDFAGTLVNESHRHLRKEMVLTRSSIMHRFGKFSAIQVD
jgi:hypothetical protein